MPPVPANEDHPRWTVAIIKNVAVFMIRKQRQMLLIEHFYISLSVEFVIIPLRVKASSLRPRKF